MSAHNERLSRSMLRTIECSIVLCVQKNEGRITSVEIISFLLVSDVMIVVTIPEKEDIISSKSDDFRNALMKSL
jgi:hypothetical protein